VPVTVRLRVTDDQGDTRMTSVTVRFAACGVQVHDVPYEAWHRISGDGYDGTYEAQLTMYRYSAQGFWRFDNVMLGDEANNYRYQFAADLPQAEFDRGFDQTGPGDCDVPHLAGFSISPTVVDGARPTMPATGAPSPCRPIPSGALGSYTRCTSPTGWATRPTCGRTISVPPGSRRRSRCSRADGRGGMFPEADP